MTELITDPDGLARPAWATRDALLREYYDTEWGVPVTEETGLFERIALEGFQSGLSWATILRKRAAFRTAFAGFDPDRVAAFGPDDVERLLADPRIIRNRAKIEATVRGARATIRLRDDGGLPALIWSFRPATTPVPRHEAELPTATAESAALAAALKRAGFSFVGPTTAYALMSAVGLVDLHLVGSHRRGCSGLWNPDGTRAREVEPDTDPVPPC